MPMMYTQVKEFSSTDELNRFTLRHASLIAVQDVKAYHSTYTNRYLLIYQCGDNGLRLY